MRSIRNVSCSLHVQRRRPFASGIPVMMMSKKMDIKDLYKEESRVWTVDPPGISSRR
jgi:hypothetical protein